MNEPKNYKEDDEFPGYPVYPESEDIYNNLEKEEDINPDTISERVLPDLTSDSVTRGVGISDVVDTELDVPGTELDDVQENIGTEDEENNYYSLGGDRTRILRKAVRDEQ